MVWEVRWWQCLTVCQIKHWSYTSETQLDMTDMVDGLILEGGLGLTGNVNKLKSAETHQENRQENSWGLSSLFSRFSWMQQLDAGERKTRLTRCGGGKVELRLRVWKKTEWGSISWSVCSRTGYKSAGQLLQHISFLQPDRSTFTGHSSDPVQLTDRYIQ